MSAVGANAPSPTAAAPPRSPATSPAPPRLRAALALAAWPLTVGACVAWVALGLRASLNGTLIAAVAMFGTQLALAGVERIAPLRASWRAPDGQRWHDVGHYAASLALGNAAALFVTPWLAEPARDALARALGGAAPWPARWPLALQIALGVAVAEFGLYWQHRAMHRYAWLWRFHAVHHEGVRLDVLKSSRQHALDFATATLAAVVPLYALGAPAPVLLYLSALSAALGLLQHANVDLRTPAWLDAWVCTPANHMLHHSRDLREGNLNFGVYLVLFDRLFGTFERPRAPAPALVGLEGDPPPRTFVRELIGALDPAHAAPPARPPHARSE